MSKAYDTLLRLQRWQLDEERRRLAVLYREQEQINLTNTMLERRRQDEARVDDVDASRAYPGYAARVRADQARLAETLAELDEQVAAKQNDVAGAYLAMKQVEIVRDKQRAAALRIAARREQARLDEVGLDLYRRRGAVGTTRA
jgi:flagellar export protein FliJ